MITLENKERTTGRTNGRKNDQTNEQNIKETSEGTNERPINKLTKNIEATIVGINEWQHMHIRQCNFGTN